MGGRGGSTTPRDTQERRGQGDLPRRERRLELNSASQSEGARLDSIPETEVIESIETGTCEEEETSVKDETPVEERSDGCGMTWRQRQTYAELFSALPNDE